MLLFLFLSLFLRLDFLGAFVEDLVDDIAALEELFEVFGRFLTDWLLRGFFISEALESHLTLNRVLV